MPSRLRLSLGPHEVATITTALQYMLDTWRDPDDEWSPEDRDLMARLQRAWDHIVREKYRQGFRDRRYG